MSIEDFFKKFTQNEASPSEIQERIKDLEIFMTDNSKINLIPITEEAIKEKFREQVKTLQDKIENWRNQVQNFAIPVGIPFPRIPTITSRNVARNSSLMVTQEYLDTGYIGMLSYLYLYIPLKGQTAWTVEIDGIPFQSYQIINQIGTAEIPAKYDPPLVIRSNIKLIFYNNSSQAVCTECFFSGLEYKLSEE